MTMLARWTFVCSVFLLVLTVPVPSGAQPASLPWIKQKSEMDCGRAVLASLSTRSGQDVEKIYWKISNPKDPAQGYSLNELIAQARRFNVTLSLVAPRSPLRGDDCTVTPGVESHLKMLGRLAQSGSPVVVLVRTRMTSGHYLILTGFQDGHFTIHDPATEGLRPVSLPELAEQMCSAAYLALQAKYSKR